MFLDPGPHSQIITTAPGEVDTDSEKVKKENGKVNFSQVQSRPQGPPFSESTGVFPNPKGIGASDRWRWWGVQIGPKPTLLQLSQEPMPMPLLKYGRILAV